MKELVTEKGERHGLINSLQNKVPAKHFDKLDPEAKKKAEALRKDEAKVVKARYINYVGDNERLERPYCRWAGDPIQQWKFIPGHTYEVPYGLVKEVNDPRYKMPVRSEILDSKGMPTVKEGQSKRIHELVPCSF